MTKLICDKCAVEIPQGSKFCPQCADPVTTADQVSKQEAQRSESVRLVCPKCRAEAVYEIPANGRSGVSCGSCKTEFRTHVTRIRSKRARGAKKDCTRTFTVRVQDFDGNEDLLEFVNASYDDFELRSKDLAAFSYQRNDLRIVQNLSVNQYMTVRAPWCFVASSVFGPRSPEVTWLRIFRDEHLAPAPGGVAAVRAYYRWSPKVVSALSTYPLLLPAVRVLLTPVVWLARRGTGARASNKRLLLTPKKGQEIWAWRSGLATRLAVQQNRETS